MEFEKKRMELERIILQEVTETQKEQLLVLCQIQSLLYNVYIYMCKRESRLVIVPEKRQLEGK